MATQLDSTRPDLGSLRIDEGKRAKSSRGRRIVYAAMPVLIFTGLVVAAYTLRNQRAVVEVATAAKPEAGGPQALLNASGYITPRRRATIAAKITGRVTGVFFDEGTRVAQGQLLATLDDSDTRRALDSAKADRDSAQAAIADFEVQLKNAQIALRRAEQLQKAGIQTQEALDNASTAVESLQAKAALARQQAAAAESRIHVAQQAVDNCTIRAPFAGIVVSKDAQVGEMVSPVSAGGGFTRTGIATIVDMHSNEIEVDVNESYIARVRPEQPVTATLDAYPDKPIPAKVRTVIPTADRQKATVKVRITIIDLEKHNFILPDMGVKVAFLEEAKPPAKGKAGDGEQEKGAEAVAYIPKSAVRSGGGASFVYVVREGKAERRAVKLGMDRASDVAVLAGVRPGDSLVVKGPENLKDGDPVEIRE
ncbi:MAG: efflux RND transporter periplasmic adaptor subunit [Acidobacteriia bacterium]|nr:efflux RND transporter periplasmic adaptor subunit [Terriglobia bacterium]